jgi:hypothetical protein
MSIIVKHLTLFRYVLYNFQKTFYIDDNGCILCRNNKKLVFPNNSYSITFRFSTNTRNSETIFPHSLSISHKHTRTHTFVNHAYIVLSAANKCQYFVIQHRECMIITKVKNHQLLPLRLLIQFYHKTFLYVLSTLNEFSFQKFKFKIVYTYMYVWSKTSCQGIHRRPICTPALNWLTTDL